MLPIRLSDEDLAYLLFLLQNASQPLTTADLVRALQERAAK